MLLAWGFTFEAPDRHDSAAGMTAAYYRQFKAVVPFCTENHSPPNLFVHEYYLVPPAGGRAVHTFEVSIRQCAPQGWVHLKYYSLYEEELLERFERIEAALVAAWRALFTVEV